MEGAHRVVDEEVHVAADAAADGHDLSRVMEALGVYRAATGEEPLMLGGWEAEDAAIRPPDALLDRLRTIAPQPLRYAYAKDLRRAKERAAEVFASSVRLDGEPVAPANVAVLQNSTQGLLLALAALKERGVQRVVIAAPCYFAAVEACRRLGLPVRIVPAADYLTGALDVERIATAMRVGSAALLLTNPAYSLGVEYPWPCLARLFAALPEHAYVLLDETRLGLGWRDDRPWYAASFPPGLLLLRSPSKVFLVNGVKTSFLVGPGEAVRGVERLSEALVGSYQGNTEAVALTFLDSWHRWAGEIERGHIGPLRTWQRGVVVRLAHNLDVTAGALAPLGFSLSPVDSGPYVLAGIGYDRMPGLESRAIARRSGVLLMESSYFFHCSQRWTGFRINLSGDAARTREAIARVFGPT
jgi:aspartate/methionine/tyrosine aminotransferase